MGALEDVQKTLNTIRRISSGANSRVQLEILELILQTSISQLKALSLPQKPVARRKPSLPLPRPAPKQNTSNIPKPSTAVDAVNKISDVNALKAIKPQAPIS